MLPQLEQQALYMSMSGWTMTPFHTNKLVLPPQVYICPSETTAEPGSVVRPDWHETGWGGGNYVPNVQAFNHWTPTGVNAGPNPFTHPELRHLVDGTSNTAAFAERYAICPAPALGDFGRTHWLGTPAAKYDSIFAWNAYTVPPVGPLAGGDKFAGRKEVPQIAPTFETCNPLLVQTPHAAMNILLFDGSVQSIGGEIDYVAWRAYILPADEGALPPGTP